jgi:hypothetical protein
MAIAVRIVVIMLLFLSAQGCGRRTPDAQAILDKAIEAHGGEAKILQPRKGKVKGEETGPGIGMSWEEIFDLPRRSRRTIRSSGERAQGTIIRILNDDQFLMQRSNGQEERRAATPIDQLNNSFGGILLLARIKHNAAKLSLLADGEVRGTPATGVRVTAKGAEAVDLYFSKNTGLLVKATVTAKMPSGKDMLIHNTFWDYRQVDGVTLPYRWSLSYGPNQTHGVAGQITEFQILEQVNEEEFKLP